MQCTISIVLFHIVHITWKFSFSVELRNFNANKKKSRSYLDVVSHCDADDGRTLDRRVTRCLLPLTSCNRLILQPLSHGGFGDLDTALGRVEVANPCGMAIGPYCTVTALCFMVVTVKS